MSKRIPAQCFHPGEFIADELVARGWSVDELALRISRKQVVATGLVQEIIDGKASHLLWLWGYNTPLVYPLNFG